MHLSLSCWFPLLSSSIDFERQSTEASVYIFPLLTGKEKLYLQKNVLCDMISLSVWRGRERERDENKLVCATNREQTFSLNIKPQTRPTG